MAIAVANFEDIVKDIPVGAWVAISESRHEVMAFGPDALTVVNEARGKGEETPLLVKVTDQAVSLFL